MKKNKIALTLAATLSLYCAQPAFAATNLLLIVDSSNSMWGQVDGKAKMETARTTLKGLVSDLPSDTKLALMAYGHRREKDCKDVELLSGIGKDTPDMVGNLISSLKPMGMTPIANALESAKDAFKGLDGQNNHIVLVSDGIESCEGDPCAVAKSLREAGINVRAHVIGFNITADEGKKLNCIAENTGGKFFDAGDVASFNEAVTEVTKLAQAEPAAAPTPEPAPAPELKPSLYFEDKFEEPELSTDWAVANPNPDQFIVENGKLLLIGKGVGTLAKADIPNIIKLNKELPAGDWTVTIEMQAELQTGRDQFSYGLYDDAQNFIIGNFYATNEVCCYSSNLFLQTLKTAGGETTKFEDRILENGTRDFDVFVKTVPGKGKMTLKLVKQDRTYKSLAHLDGHKDEKGNDIWIETEVVTSLRAPKQFVMNASQFDETDGETMYQIDSVTIEEMK